MIKGIIFDFVWTLYDPEANGLLPESMAMLQKLRQRGLKLGLISFGGKEKRQLLESLGLMQVLHWVHVVSEKKPEFFKEFLDKFGFLPQETLVVGDRLDAEIAVGQSLGMKTAWIRVRDFTPPESAAKPDFVISSVLEVVDLVARPVGSVKESGL